MSKEFQDVSPRALGGLSMPREIQQDVSPSDADPDSMFREIQDVSPRALGVLSQLWLPVSGWISPWGARSSSCGTGSFPTHPTNTQTLPRIPSAPSTPAGLGAAAHAGKGLEHPLAREQDVPSLLQIKKISVHPSPLPREAFPSRHNGLGAGNQEIK